MNGPFESLLPDVEATQDLGRRLGRLIEPGLVVALLGDLGAGKTSLAKALIAVQGRVSEDDVVSPTFVLACEYPGSVEVVHIDAYRLGGPEDLTDLGFELHSQVERAVLVEWAERVQDALPPDRLTVELEHDPGGRRVRVTAGGPRSERILACLRDAH